MVPSTGVTGVPRIAARGWLILLFAVSVYRAVTQSIVYDEALTWELYIAGPFSAIFHHFDANHHFLNTLLMRLSTGIFGVLGMVPTLAGAGRGGAVLHCRLSRGPEGFWRGVDIVAGRGPAFAPIHSCWISWWRREDTGWGWGCGCGL